MSTLKTNTIQHLTSGFNNVVQFVDGAGTQNGTLCRAWVNFNGTGASSPFTIANGSIRAAFNVSSVTDNGTGDYTVNFSNALADANYSAVGSAGRGASGGNGGRQVTTNCLTNPTTSACRINSTDGGGVNQDLEFISVAIFR